MFALTRPRLLIAVIVGAAGVAFAALLAFAAFSSTASADHSWGTYHWKKASTGSVEVPLGDNLSSGWDSYLQTTSGDPRWPNSVNDWNDPWNDPDDNPDTGDFDALNTPIVPGGTTNDPRKCRPSSGKVEVCNAKYGYNGWLGVAQIWISGGHIVQGTGKMNDSYFNTTKYNTPEWKNFVMCQEVGHTFGLDHQDEDFDNENLETCMDYTRNPSGGQQYPNAHDYKQLKSIYGTHSHDTATTSTSSASNLPAEMNEFDTNDPREWGKKIKESPDGRFETYERDFGGGKKVFTHVIRADREDQPGQQKGLQKK